MAKKIIAAKPAASGKPAKPAAAKAKASAKPATSKAAPKPVKASASAKPVKKAAPAAPKKKAAAPAAKSAKPVVKKPAAKPAPATKKQAVAAKPKAAAAPKKAAAKAVAPKTVASKTAAPAPKAAKPTAKPASSKPGAAGKTQPKPAPKGSEERKLRTDRLVQAMRNAAADRSARKLSSKQTTPSRNKVTKKPTSSGGSKPAAAAAQDDAAAKARKLTNELERPTGSYNGILLCDEVKPFPKKSPYTDKELEKLGEALTAEREQLRRELVSLEGVGREALDLSREHPGYSVHMAEHATDLQTAEANMGIHRVELERLHAVESALERIEKMPARYGLCLACGSKIGIQRLAARPHAHLCMDCQQRYERIKARRGL